MRSLLRQLSRSPAINPFQLIEGDCHIVLAQAENATQPRMTLATLPDLSKITSWMSPIFSFTSLYTYGD